MMLQEKGYSDIQTQECNVVNNSPFSKNDVPKTRKIGVLKIDSKEYPIYKGINIIGRHPKCHINLSHMTVSKKHAEIEADDSDAIFISDLQSSNGTALKQKLLRPNKSYQLLPGNKLTFGEVQASFELDDNEDTEFIVPESPNQNNIKKPTEITSLNSFNQSRLESTILNVSSPSNMHNPGLCIANKITMSTSTPKAVFSNRKMNDVSKLTQNSSVQQFSNNFTNGNKLCKQNHDAKQITDSNDPQISNELSSTKFVEQCLNENDKSKSQNTSGDVIEKNMHNIFGELSTDEHVFNSSRMVTQQLENLLQITDIQSGENDSLLSSTRLDHLKNPENLERLSTASIDSENYYSGLKTKRKTNILGDSQSSVRIINTSNDEINKESVKESEEDDILKDLPKFNITSNLSNTSSPKSVTSDSSEDLSTKKYTPRTLKFKSVLKSLKSTKIYKKLDDEFKEVEKLGERVLQTESAYDKIKDPVSGELGNINNKNNESEDIVEKNVNSNRRGKSKKVEQLKTLESPRMNPLPVVKVKNMKIKKLKIVLEPIDNSEDYLKNGKTTECKDNVTCERTLRNANKLAEEKNIKSEQKIGNREIEKSKQKRVINEVDDEGLETKSEPRAKRKKTENKKKEINTALNSKNIRLSPVTNRRHSLSLSHSPNETINNSFNVSITSPRKLKFKVLFTGVDSDRWRKKLIKLGVTEANDIATCTVLVTDKVKRTVKFLCALSRGIPIISVKWLEDSYKAKKCLDCDSYILEDSVAEKKFKFKLRESLQLAKEKKLFYGTYILLTPQISSPPLADLKDIIKFAGGNFLIKVPRKWPKNTVIVTQEDDFVNAKKFAVKAPKNVTIQTTEFILSAVLRQKLDFTSYILEVKK